MSQLSCVCLILFGISLESVELYWRSLICHVSTPGSELVGLQRTTSSESGTGSVTDMSSRVGSLLGSIRAKTGVVIGEPGQQQDTGEIITTSLRG